MVVTAPHPHRFGSPINLTDLTILLIRVVLTSDDRLIAINAPALRGFYECGISRPHWVWL